MSGGVSGVVKWPLRTMLKSKPLRAKLIYEIGTLHYADLNFAIPIGNGLVAPVTAAEHLTSFEEIFFTDEYALLDQLPTPRRWLDLGCHAGYFSLKILSRRRAKGIKEPPEALLVDADSRSRIAVERLIQLNGLQNQMQHRHAAIAAKGETVAFVERSCMSSSLAGSIRAEPASTVPVLTAQQIVTSLRPPYDLIKIDVEGAEHDFFTAYSLVVQQAKAILLEWHSWHTGGGGFGQLHELLGRSGFRLQSPPEEGRETSWEGKPARCGLALFVRAST